jgi:fido (protein-threonine AMPylation protein)
MRTYTRRLNIDEILGNGKTGDRKGRSGSDWKRPTRVPPAMRPSRIFQQRKSCRHGDADAFDRSQQPLSGAEIDMSDENPDKETASQIIAKRITELQVRPIIVQESKLAQLHLQEIHRRLFEGLREGAGVYRDTDLRDKDGNARKDATPGRYVAGRSEVIFKTLERDGFLQNLEREPFIRKLGDVLTGLRQLQPFGDGEALVRKVFAGVIAKNAGYTVDLISANERELEAALTISLRENDPVQLHTVLRNATKATRAVAFEDAMRTGKHAAALRAHPELLYAFALAKVVTSGPPVQGRPDARQRVQATKLRSIQSALDAGLLTQPLSPAAEKKFLARAHERTR